MLFVFRKLHGERVRGVKFLLIPKSSQELNREGFSVEISFKIKEMNFYGYVHPIKSGSSSNVHHSPDCVSPRQFHLRRVHPALGDEFAGILQCKVGRWVANLSPSSFPPSHNPLKPVWTPQKLSGPLDVARFGEKVPDAARGHDVVVHLHRRNDIHLKSILWAELPKKFHVPCPLFSKAMIIPHRNLLQANSPNQHLRHVVGRLQLRKFRRKGHHYETIDAEPL